MLSGANMPPMGSETTETHEPCKMVHCTAEFCVRDVPLCVRVVLSVYPGASEPSPLAFVDSVPEGRSVHAEAMTIAPPRVLPFALPLLTYTQPLSLGFPLQHMVLPARQ